MIQIILVKHTLLLLMIAAAFAFLVSCDGNNNNNMDCLDASNNSNILENNIECPTDALVQMCNTFICQPVELGVIFLPEDCMQSGCFDFSCDVRENSDPLTVIGTGDFNIETVAGNTITGVVFITVENTQEDMEFEYVCSPFIQ